MSHTACSTCFSLSSTQSPLNVHEARYQVSCMPLLESCQSLRQAEACRTRDVRHASACRQGRAHSKCIKRDTKFLVCPCLSLANLSDKLKHVAHGMFDMLQLVVNAEPTQRA